MEEELKLQLNPTSLGVYYDGSIVSGNLSVVLKKPQAYKCARVSLVGYSHVQWVETSNNSMMPRVQTSTHVSDQREVYRGTSQRLQIGEHCFTFQFVLPAGIPSTFEGTYGHTRYWISAELVSTSNEVAAREETNITVVQKMSTDSDKWMKPVKTKVEKAVCCWCCVSGPIVMTVELPRRGYCIGEIVPLRAMVDNSSRREVRVRSQLRMYTSYKVHTPPSGSKHIKREIVTLADHHSNVIRPGSADIYIENIELANQLPITTVGKSWLIGFKYVLHVELSVAWGRNISVQIVPIIGSVKPRPQIRILTV